MILFSTHVYILQHKQRIQGTKILKIVIGKHRALSLEVMCNFRI